MKCEPWSKASGRNWFTNWAITVRGIFGPQGKRSGLLPHNNAPDWGFPSAAVALLASSAHAEPPLPPKEYDHPYGGRLDIVIVETEQQALAECPVSQSRIGSPLRSKL